jgi:hypothetical protein
VQSKGGRNERQKEQYGFGSTPSGSICAVMHIILKFIDILSNRHENIQSKLSVMVRFEVH